MLAGTLAGMHQLAVTIDAGWVLGGVVLFLVTQVLTGIIVVRVTGARHAERIASLFKISEDTSEQLTQITQPLERHNDAIVATEKNRLKCRNECVDKGEYVRMVGTFTDSERVVGAKLDGMRGEIGKSLGELHHRVTEVAKAVEYIRGQKEAS